MSKHKHHIIPRYKCEELGIDPDFPENIVEVTRLDHALIHWGYKCDDLEPLFKYVRPSQEIIDLIPRGDDRDGGAAVILAEGEIDGIDISGKKHPRWGKKSNFYKDGRAGVAGSKEREWYNKRRKSRNTGQAIPKEEYDGLNYRQWFYKNNKEELDKKNTKKSQEYIVIQRTEKLVKLIEKDVKRFGFCNEDILVDEVEYILDYMIKHNIDPKIFISYNLFDMY